MAWPVDTNRTSRSQSTSSKQPAFPIEPILIIDDQDVPGNSVASLQYELSILNDSIEAARDKREKSQARRHKEKVDLLNRHTAEKNREDRDLENLLNDQKELQARLSRTLQSSAVSQSKNSAFSGSSATGIKLESGLTGNASLGTAGTQIVTPVSSQTPTPPRQAWSSPELKETPGRRAKIDNATNGQVKIENQAGSGSGPALSHPVGRRGQSEREGLLKAFGAQYGSSTTSSTPVPRPRDGSALNSSSTARVKVEDNESDGSFEVVLLSDEDDRPLARRNRVSSDVPSGPIRGRVPTTTSSNGVQYTAAARKIKRERSDDEELASTPSPKRTQKHVRASTAADGRRIKMEDGELVAWPVRMPPYIRQLTDFSLKQQFPETNHKFSRAFLTMCLGGNAYETRPRVGQERRANQIYDVDEYHCWSPDWNPHIPPKRGVHGATLSIDIWEGNSERLHRMQRVTLEDGSYGLNEDLQVPRHTFCKRRELEFEYVGKYSQGRYFERLTNEEYETEVPEKIRTVWAGNIVVKEWGARMLIEGGIVRTKEEAKNLSPAAIRELMDRPDDHPGKKLRFFWRYLEFHEYDKNFYEALAAKGRELGYTTKPDRAPYEFGHPTRYELEDAADSPMPTGTEGPGGPSSTNSGERNERSDFTMVEREDALKEESKVLMKDPRSLYEDSD